MLIESSLGNSFTVDVPESSDTVSSAHAHSLRAPEVVPDRWVRIPALPPVNESVPVCSCDPVLCASVAQKILKHKNEENFRTISFFIAGFIESHRTTPKVFHFQAKFAKNDEFA